MDLFIMVWCCCCCWLMAYRIVRVKTCEKTQEQPNNGILVRDDVTVGNVETLRALSSLRVSKTISARLEVDITSRVT